MPPSFLDLCSYLLFKVIISIHFHWSSSHEENTKIIQEGLLNPSVDILEAMTETEAMHTGKIFLPILRSSIPQLEPFSFNTFSLKCFLFPYFRPYLQTNVTLQLHILLQLYAYIIIQLHIINQRPRIMIVYHVILEVIQNNLICIIRFHGVDIPMVFQWGHQ